MPVGPMLAGYLERIGLSALPPMSRDGLSALVDAHMRHIPFEHFDVLLGREISLEPAVVYDKLVTRRRGGYCFEHATLVAEVLRGAGWQVAVLGGRVRLGKPVSMTPRTHMFLAVTLGDRRFLADPGFGGPGPRAAIALEPGAEVETRDARFRIRESESGLGWMLQRGGEEWRDLYLFDQVPQQPADLMVANHYTATHPESVFRNRIMAQRATPDGGIAILDRRVTERSGEQTRGWQLESRGQLRSLLSDRFGIDLPEVASLRVPGIPEWA